MAESIHCSPETVTTLLVHYTLIQNKMFKKKKRMSGPQGGLCLVGEKDKRIKGDEYSVWWEGIPRGFREDPKKASLEGERCHKEERDTLH